MLFKIHAASMVDVNHIDPAPSASPLLLGLHTQARERACTRPPAGLDARAVACLPPWLWLEHLTKTSPLRLLTATHMSFLLLSIIFHVGGLPLAYNRCRLPTPVAQCDCRAHMLTFTSRLQRTCALPPFLHPTRSFMATNPPVRLAYAVLSRLSRSPRPLQIASGHPEERKAAVVQPWHAGMRACYTHAGTQYACGHAMLFLRALNSERLP